KGLQGQKEAKTVKKPTRNERDKKKSEETAKDQSRISPTQQERQSKIQNEVKRTKSDKLSKFKGLLGVIKIKGPKLPNEESALLKKKNKSYQTQGLILPFLKPL
ncbi:hypothetical protein Tco_1481557, partial [Tanacetum coccineum]